MPLLAGGLLLFCLPVNAQETPEGWKSERGGGSVTYTPGDLPSGKTYNVRIFPREPRRDKSLTAWLRSRIAADPNPPGTPAGDATAREESPQVAVGVRAYQTAAGGKLTALYYGVSVDARSGRLIRVTFSGDGNFAERYKDATLALVREAVTNDRDAAAKNDASEGRGGGEPGDAAPGIPNGAARGGKLVVGTYSGNRVHGDGKVLGRFNLSLYANGEWLLANENGKEIKTGEYKYDPKTGKIDIDVVLNLYNSTYHPDEDFCVYYRDRDGTPVIYAEDYYGVGTARITLRYAGPNAIAKSPTETKKATEAARAEARRFKWVTPPGKGVPSARIEGILHTGRYVYTATGGEFQEHVYLLLKDGTVYDGLPCPPDQLDVAASRRNEPKSWGQWKRDGAKISARWRADSGAWDAWEPLSSASFVLPAQAGERLSGRYETGKAYNYGASSSVFFHGVTFTPAGRFTTDQTAMHGTTGGTADDTKVYAYGDDEGSSVTVTGPTVGGGSTSKRAPGQARTGTYSLTGYVLTLKFDDGRVVRQPFFFWDAKKTHIWFRDTTYSKPKK
jgi:hypothetical protein